MRLPSLKKCIPHLFEAIANNPCVDVFHGETAAALMSFLIAYSSHAAAIQDGAPAVGRKYGVEGC